VTAAKTRSQLGKMSRNKGAKAERDLVTYLRMVGFGGAERAVRTGYRTATRTSADPGDITGTPGIVWSVKDAAVERIDAWLEELDAMAADPRLPVNDVRLLVHKRRGHAIPDKWWCWLRLDALMALNPTASWSHLPDPDVPVRMELGHVIDLLHFAGYGDPTEESA
jgi:hypothetical protein